MEKARRRDFFDLKIGVVLLQLHGTHTYTGQNGISKRGTPTRDVPIRCARRPINPPGSGRRSLKPSYNYRTLKLNSLKPSYNYRRS